MRPLRYLLAALCLLATPALAQVPMTGAGVGKPGAVVGPGPLSTPVKLGTCYTAASGTTCVITAANNCPAGSLIWVAMGFRINGGTFSSVSDSQSNSYGLETAVAVPTNGYGSRSAHSLNTTHALTASTDTITITVAGSATTNGRTGAAYCVANNSGTFATDTGTTNTGSTTPYTLVSLSNSMANSIAFAYFLSSSGTTWTFASTGWTNLDNAGTGFNLNTSYVLLPTITTPFAWTSLGCGSSCPPSANWAGQDADFHD